MTPGQVVSGKNARLRGNIPLSLEKTPDEVQETKLTFTHDYKVDKRVFRQKARPAQTCCPPTEHNL